MSHLFRLDKQHLNRIKHMFPKPGGVARSGDRKILSGIIHLIRNGLRWRNSPAAYGPHKGRNELKASRCYRCIGSSDKAVSKRR